MYGPEDGDILSAMRRCRVVCVVCTPKMAELLCPGSRGKLKRSLDWYFSEVGERGLVMPVLTRGCTYVSAFLSDSRCSRSIDSSQEDFLDQICERATERSHRLFTAPCPK